MPPRQLPKSKTSRIICQPARHCQPTQPQMSIRAPRQETRYIKPRYSKPCCIATCWLPMPASSPIRLSVRTSSQISGNGLKGVGWGRGWGWGGVGGVRQGSKLPLVLGVLLYEQARAGPGAEENPKTQNETYSSNQFVILVNTFTNINWTHKHNVKQNTQPNPARNI